MELDASLEQLSAVMLDQEHVEIRAAVRLDLIAFVQEVMQNIEEATESEPDLEMLRNRPGLVGYIAKAGVDRQGKSYDHTKYHGDKSQKK